MQSTAVQSPQFMPHRLVGALQGNYFDQLCSQFDQLSKEMCQYVHDNRRRYQAMPPCGERVDRGMRITRNTGNEASVKAGEDSFDFKKSDSEFSITDSNGKTTTIWGDPHFKNADGTPAADIHGDSVITLSDGTRVFVKTSDANGERERDGSRPTYTKSVAIVRPDGSTIFVDNIAGPKALEISTPPYGQMPLDFVREKMNGDFRPEAYLSIDSQGRWTDMNGLPLTQASANAMRDIARSQEPLSASLASGFFTAGMFPRSVWNNPGFDPAVRNATYYGEMSRTQAFLEHALQGSGLSQLAMSGAGGNMLLQIVGAALASRMAGGGLGALLGEQAGQAPGASWLSPGLLGQCDDEFGDLPMYGNEDILGSIYGGCEQQSRITPGYSAAALADHFERQPLPGGRAPTLSDLRDLANSPAADPRVRGAARFLVDDYDKRGTRSFWSQIESLDDRGRHDNISGVWNFRNYANAAGYGDVHPLASPYRPPMPSVLEQAFGGDFMRAGYIPAPSFPRVNPLQRTMTVY